MGNPPVDASLPPVKYNARGLQSSTCAISVIMHSRGRPAKFSHAIDSLARTCTATSEVEIIMKVDSDDSTIPEYLSILNSCPFAFKMLTYDRLDAYWSVHVFQNDLSRIANGTILWCFNEDNEIVSGDWVKALRETRDIYADNIYVVKVPGSPPKLDKTVAPAYSIEWFNVQKIVSPHIYSDTYLCTLATVLGRFVSSGELAKINFRHLQHEKIGRPSMNTSVPTMKLLMHKQINMAVPYFREAIAAAAPTAAPDYKVYPPGTKIGPGYTLPPWPPGIG